VSHHLNPPVHEGEVLTVTIREIGDEGDGIAKVDRGYILIVPGGKPDETVTVEVVDVHERYAFGEIIGE
jgi:predicted RNA-binding protein with TRAM domain